MVVANSSSADEVFEQFDIEFDAGPEPVFHGGELISGQLKIKLNNEATLNAIHLQFKGKAVWIGAGKKADKEGQTEKIYFDKNFVLLERPPGHPEPGHFKWNAHFVYSLPFECPLPLGCETSYESPAAHIRYYARAILETEKQEKYIVKKAFTIVSPPDMHHLVPPQSEPVSHKETVRFGGCCCRSKIDAEIQLPKSTFAPGERIVGTFSIDSRTAKQAIDHIEVRLLDSPERILAEPATAKEVEAVEVQPDVATTDPTEQNSAKGKKKRVVKAKSKVVVRKPQTSSGTQHQRVVAGVKLDPDQLLPGPDQPRRKSRMITQHNVAFITVPAVIPTIKKESDDPFVRPPHREEDEELEEGQQRFSKLLESPSTATIRARREPFIGVKYSLQIALGNHILLEVPIEVHPIPIYAKEIGFRPFAGGAQPITEPDEAKLHAHRGPFTFTPQYPVYLNALTLPMPAQNAEALTETAQRQSSPPNGITTTTPVVVGSPELTATTTRTIEIHKQLVPNGAHDGGDGIKHTVVTVQQVHHQPIIQQITMDIQQPPVAAENNVVEEQQQEVETEPRQNGQMTVEEVQSDDGQTVRRVVEESYEVKNEDGSKTTVHKTTEQTIKTSTGEVEFEQSVMANEGDENGVIEDGGQAEVPNGGTEQQQNQQMDVSMSG